MKLLVDSDCLVGSFREGDPYYHRAQKLLTDRHIAGDEMCVLNLVIQEAATVLSHKTGMNAVRDFYSRAQKLSFIIIDLDSDLEKEAWKIFLEQTKKGCSFVDCANLAVIAKYKMKGILSFDEFYPNELRLT